MTGLWRNSYVLLVVQNRLVKISANCLLHADFEQKLRTIVTELLTEGKGATVSETASGLARPASTPFPFASILIALVLILTQGRSPFLRRQYTLRSGYLVIDEGISACYFKKNGSILAGLSPRSNGLGLAFE